MSKRAMSLNERKQQIDQRAHTAAIKVLDSLAPTQLPIKVIALAESIGITVGHSNLPPEIISSSWIDDGVPKIVLNTKLGLDDAWLRFQVAVHLGRFAHYEDYPYAFHPQLGSRWNILRGNPPTELGWFSHSFAARLLLVPEFLCARTDAFDITAASARACVPRKVIEFSWGWLRDEIVAAHLKAVEDYRHEFHLDSVPDSWIENILWGDEQ